MNINKQNCRLQICPFVERWWKEKAKIDLSCLGGGLLLVVGYFVYFEKNPTSQTALKDIWPNIASNILGIWISVRLIESLINQRNIYHSKRRKLISDLNSFKFLSQFIQMSTNEKDFLQFRIEFENFSEYLPKWKTFLTDKESMYLDDCVSIGNQLLQIINNFLICIQVPEDIFNKITSTYSSLNYRRDCVNKKIIDVNQNLADITTLQSRCDILLEEIVKFEPYLSTIEKESLNTYIDFYKKSVDLLCSVDSPNQKTKLEIPILKTIKADDYQLFFELIESIKRNGDTSNISTFLLARENYINSDAAHKQVPSELLKHLEKFIKYTKISLNEKNNINSCTDKFCSLIRETTQELIMITDY